MAAAAEDTTQLFEGIMTDYEKKLEQQQKLLDLVRPSVRINGGAVTEYASFRGFFVVWISFAGKSCDLDHDFHCMRDFTVTAAGRNRSVNFTPSMFYRRLTSCYTHTDSAGLLVAAP